MFQTIVDVIALCALVALGVYIYRHKEWVSADVGRAVTAVAATKRSVMDHLVSVRQEVAELRKELDALKGKLGGKQ